MHLKPTVLITVECSWKDPLGFPATDTSLLFSVLPNKIGAPKSQQFKRGNALARCIVAKYTPVRRFSILSGWAAVLGRGFRWPLSFARHGSPRAANDLLNHFVLSNATISRIASEESFQCHDWNDSPATNLSACKLVPWDEGCYGSWW
jgi:hypothetical protein